MLQANTNRRKVRLAINYGPTLHKRVTDQTVNMSPGGVFIETADILPAGTLLFVEFKLPGKEKPVACKAKVAWTNEPGNLKSHSQPAGIGLQFFSLSLENMDDLREFLAKGECSPPDAA